MKFLYLRITLATIAFKLLLCPSYKSTDFEVHRNWMAITHSLPISSWYIEETSQWTLDYPPLFAWLEYFFSLFAKYFDPKMLGIKNLNYDSEMTILYQRLTVILSEFILTSAAYKISKKHEDSYGIFIYCLVIFNTGLIIIDHIHFQYNGLLLGILIWSILNIEAGNHYIAAILFSILLNMKHLFVYAAPLYLSYLLATECKKSIYNFFKLGFCVISIFIISFGPFIYYNQITIIIKRLFPFGRGLCHAYWAPNAWALYAFTDKVLFFIFKYFLKLENIPTAQLTGGLVGISKFSILPQITPLLSLFIVFLFISISAIALYINPKPHYFMDAIAYANLTGFIWGYHIHEKAILTVLIPLIFRICKSPESEQYKLIYFDFDDYMLFSFISHFSLLPLLFKSQEYPLKIIILISYTLLCYIFKLKYYNQINYLFRLKFIYMLLLCLLELYSTFLHKLIFKDSYEFIPLMLISIFSAIGIFAFWLKFTIQIINQNLLKSNFKFKMH